MADLKVLYRAGSDFLKEGRDVSSREPMLYPTLAVSHRAECGHPLTYVPHQTSWLFPGSIYGSE